MAVATLVIEGTHEPGLVHYLPVLSTVISAAFLAALLRRAAARGWLPHLSWWAAGVFFYGLGTALESTITIAGNTPTLNRLWYWAGAILGGYPLATGTLYLLANRRLAHTLTAASLLVVTFASVVVLMTPINADLINRVRPSGSSLEWTWVRALTPFINVYALILLVGGAAWSSVKFTRAYLSRRSDCSPVQDANRDELGRRAIGTALIAFGGLLPGIGGTLTKTHDIPEALYIGELAGIILIWIGYELCTRRRAPARAAAANTTPAPSVIPG